MYLHMERLHRNEDDSWRTESRLVNLDHVAVLSLDKAGSATADDPVTIVLTFAAAVATEPYYFGPADMTDNEKSARLSGLLRALRSGLPVQWSLADDATARLEGRPLAVD